MKMYIKKRDTISVERYVMRQSDCHSEARRVTNLVYFPVSENNKKKCFCNVLNFNAL